MSACTVCEHNDRLAIEVDLCASGKMAWRVLAETYGLHHLALMNHQRKHMEAKPASMTIQTMRGVSASLDAVIENEFDPELTPVDEVLEPASMAFCTMQQATDDDISVQRMAEHGFRENWHRMDTTHRQRNLAWLNEQLQTDDMGLP